MSAGVYQLVNRQNGKSYIGSSYDIAQRWEQHLYQLRNGKHDNRHLQYAFDKYRAESFEMIILFQTNKHTSMVMLEQYYLDTVKPEYNIAPFARSSFGIKRTEETRKKLQLVNLGKKATPETLKRLHESHIGKSDGELNPFYGKTHSMESRLKMSKSQKQRTSHPEYRQHMREIKVGKKLSQAHRQAIGEGVRKTFAANPSIMMSPERSRKLHEANLGKPSHRRQFSTADIKEIRLLLSQDITQRAIGKLFNVGHAVIGCINRNQTYKEVS